ncbi:MAG TPA: hypothetical protein VEJ87_06150 [Acidimicrobiales bacterium]|nr:hypothetical protein [Acidimicrobiales bacterium]
MTTPWAIPVGSSRTTPTLLPGQFREVRLNAVGIKVRMKNLSGMQIDGAGFATVECVR